MSHTWPVYKINNSTSAGSTEKFARTNVHSWSNVHRSRITPSLAIIQCTKSTKIKFGTNICHCRKYLSLQNWDCWSSGVMQLCSSEWPSKTIDQLHTSEWHKSRRPVQSLHDIPRTHATLYSLVYTTTWTVSIPVCGIAQWMQWSSSRSANNSLWMWSSPSPLHAALSELVTRCATQPPTLTWTGNE